jgi:hypothetical protein
MSNVRAPLRCAGRHMAEHAVDPPLGAFTRVALPCRPGAAQPTGLALSHAPGQQASCPSTGRQAHASHVCNV